MNTLSGLMTTLRTVGFEISPAVVLDIAKILPELNSPQEVHLGLRMLIATNKQEQDLFDFIWDIESKGIVSEQIENNDKNNEQMEDSDIPGSVGLQFGDSEFLDLDVTDAPYCPNPAALASGTVGSNDPSVALIRFASDLKGPAKQLIQGNDRNAAAILMRYLLARTADLSKFGLQRAEAFKEIGEMLDYAVSGHSNALLARLDRELHELLKERLSDGQILGMSQLKIQNIEDLPLLSLKSSPELKMALQQLGKKLASKHVRRLKHGNSKINLRATIRANIQHGGTLLELRRQKKRLDRPKLVIMTDVSTSTIQATRMFLSIIWHARQVFSDIHFFEFIGSTIDVTTEWRRAHSVDNAVDEALKRWNSQYTGKQNSDYHQAFSMFDRLFGKNLTSKHTVIVLGDLRDWLGPWINNSPVSASLMGKLAQKVKRFIVLNPERKDSWNTGDSVVGYVENQGIEVYEANTLKKLIDVLLTL